MSRPICLQVYISRELDGLLGAASRAKGVSKSEWVRSLLADACARHDPGARQHGSIERIARQSVFLMVGVDALLAGHADHALRERAHQAFARKCRELGLLPSTDEGGSDEA